jgi:nitroreductase
MELYEVIKSRKSFRSFLPKKVDKEILERILAASNRSPSYMNTQPWEVFVVTGEKKDSLVKKLLSQASSGAPPRPDVAFPQEWPDAVDRRTREHKRLRLQALGVDPNDKETLRSHFLLNFEFYGAPCVLFVGMEKVLTGWSMLDLGLFSSSILFAARAEGLGCCPQALPMAYPDVIREELGISPNIGLVLAICMGYPDLKAHIHQYDTARRQLADFVKWYGFV